MKKTSLWVAVVLTLFSATAVEFSVTFEKTDGSVETRRMGTPVERGTAVFRLSRLSIGQGIRSVSVIPDFARAKAGEEGYFVMPHGARGFFTRRNGKLRKDAKWLLMPLYGMKTVRGAFVAIIKGRPWDWSFNAVATNGEYRVFARFQEDAADGDEDIEIEYRFLEGDDAGYSGMARAYRRHQLDCGACRPLLERAKSRQELAYAAVHPEVRIRQAWKPVPSPVIDQTKSTEPPVKPVVPFVRVTDLVQACSQAGVDGAEFCLVGWQRGGHDGAYPSMLPVEAKLGGEAALRATIAETRKLGYMIVGHGNHRDAYLLSDEWDAEYVNEKNADGTLRRPVETWGGGGKYTICARRTYERFALKTAAECAALGFRGLFYLDVTTVFSPYSCRDARHPMTKRDCAAWESAILKTYTDRFGGVASEGGNDACVGAYDSALTIAWERPFDKPADMIDDYVPFWQIVYHGIVLSTPFRSVMNTTANPDPRYTLKLAEFGGRPTFYVHSRFIGKEKETGMGDRDLCAITDDDIAFAADAIAKGCAEYARRRDLVYTFMDRHECIASGVFRVTYSNGVRLIANYNKNEVTSDGATVPPLDYVLIK